MHLRKFTKSNEGVVGIVVAVLLIGLLVSVVSLLQYMYVPKWMEEREAEHMDQVLTQFAELKFAIDTQIANSLNYTPIATSITLGSEKLPFLMSMRSYGSLSIFNESCNIKINYIYGGIPYSTVINLGTIRYTSANAYYIPEEKQSYVYEAGAIITNQTSGNSISIKPSFKFLKDPDNVIILKLANITGVGGKITYGGYDTIPIQTEYNNTIDNTKIFLLPTDPVVSRIDIETSYPQAWHVYLSSVLRAGGYVEGDSDEDDYSIYSDEIGVRIIFNEHEPFYYPSIEMYVNEVYGQIGPGWIE